MNALSLIELRYAQAHFLLRRTWLPVTVIVRAYTLAVGYNDEMMRQETEGRKEKTTPGYCK